MAVTNQRISVCCFKPVTENEDFYPASDDVKFYCSHCGKLADKTVLWTNGSVGNVTELVIRRFKDGDTNYQDVLSVLEQVIADNSASKLNALKATVDDGKPDKWLFNWQVRRWEKADDRVTTATSTSLKPKKGVARTLQDHPSKTNDGGRNGASE